MELEMIKQKMEVYKLRREGAFAQLQATLDVSKKAGPASIGEFLARCNELNDVKERFETCQDALLELNAAVDQKERVNVDAPTLAFDQIYYEVRATESTLKHRANPSTPNTPDVRLPKILVPNWAGDINSFHNFIALFNEVIHKGPYSNVTKLTYLRSLLSGPPLKLIETLDLSEANYTVAYNLIQNRYGSNKALATHYLNKILDFRPLKFDSTQELQTLLDTFGTNYAAFHNLEINNHSDFIMFQLASRTLPAQFRLQFERAMGDSENLPTFKQLIKFVEENCRMREFSGGPREPGSTFRSPPNVPSPRRSPYRTSQNPSKAISSTALLNTPVKSKFNDENLAQKYNCDACSGPHSLYCCPKFSEMSPNERYSLTKAKLRCFACLGAHLRTSCKSQHKCKWCGSTKHHSLLHNEALAAQSASKPISKDEPETGSTGAQALVTSTANRPTHIAAKGWCSTNVGNRNLTVSSNHSTVLLGTAQAWMQARNGSWVPIRLVIDPGSQINLITTAMAQRLKLPLERSSIQLCGVMNHKVATSTGKISCNLAATAEGGPQWCLEAHVLNKVCADLPSSTLSPEVHQSVRHLTLADNEFHVKRKIDFLLGAEIYPEIVQPERSIRHGQPSAIKTVFGWVVMGAVSHVPRAVSEHQVALTVEEKLDEALQKFWQTEEVERVICRDPKDEKAEEHFASTHARTSSGSYVVRLPFKDRKEFPPFGDSRSTATRRWRTLENKMKNNDKLKMAYNEFMQEYLERGHMRPTHENGTYLIPHFAIVRDSPTSPIRVVFDASCRDTSGFSLNDRLLTGPPLQKDITEILTCFRLEKVALTTDIKMMYRQIWVHPDDRPFQHILWRPNCDVPLQEYELCTVTYGLASSPFLAQRVLAQLVDDHGDAFPLAKQAIRDSCFMDDICISIANDEQAIQFQAQLAQLLGMAGFELRKWASNSKRALDAIPVEHQAPGITIKPVEKRFPILGLHWNPQDDVFSYKAITCELAKTKRSVLSHVASIYDPLGWVGPVVFWAKCFLQDLWAQGIGWDEPFPDNGVARWAAFASQLAELGEIKIPRMCKLANATEFQLIGMCDASNRGYAAAVYLRSSNFDNSSCAQVSLLKGKTKVAPLKVQTVPRLELNGALLLTKLLTSLEYLKGRLKVSQVLLFTDSQVVLAWLHTPPHKLKTYVANRVVKILEGTQLENWHHISSSNNAADCASRGLLPSEIISMEIWWQGPKFLRSPLTSWPIKTFEPDSLESLPDVKDNSVILINTMVSEPTPRINDLLSTLRPKFSSWTKLLRVVTRMQRFIYNARHSPNERRYGTLTVGELDDTTHLLVKVAQEEAFAQDLRLLRNGRSVTKRLLPWTPYLDDKQLLRVGGRLQRAQLHSSSMHPLLLSSKTRLAELLCDYYHVSLLHAGPQATQAIIQRSYLILGLRSLLRKRIHSCLTCHRFRTVQLQPLMGELPPDRVSPTRAFLHSGVDMAGPIQIKESNRRNARLVKAYVCVFVCMSIKAVHIELTSDLTTASFKAALDRFIARRGLCECLYSDRGTNFVGAANAQKEIDHFLKESEPEVSTYLSSKTIEYRFNPPESPWMGGSWEAAVKSIKRHLVRSVANHKLTYEELSTVLVRIEAILNSRPLCFNAEYPEDNVDFLSPGHFLIGAPLVSRSERSLLNSSPNYLARWQVVQRAVQEIWKRWSSEYLNTLIQRKKWTKPRRAPAVGDAVILRSSDTKPLEWPLARVLELHAGEDGIARSAAVKTSSGIYIRPVANLMPVIPFETLTNN